MRALAVNQTRANEFDRLVKIDEKSRSNILEALDSLQTYLFTIDELTNFFSDFLPTEEARILAATSVSLRRIADQERDEAADVLGRLKVGLAKNGWTPGRISETESTFGFLQKIIDKEVIRIVAKSSELYYRHTWHLHDLRIITDVRPVFNVARDGIIGLISKNSLFITYSDGHEDEKTLEIVVGRDALEGIREQAQIALEKSAKVDSSMGKELKIPVRHYESD